jgi:hypothetical protein
VFHFSFFCYGVICYGVFVSCYVFNITKYMTPFEILRYRFGNVLRNVSVRRNGNVDVFGWRFSYFVSIPFVCICTARFLKNVFYVKKISVTYMVDK